MDQRHDARALLSESVETAVGKRGETKQACMWTLIILAVVVLAALIAIGVVIGMQQSKKNEAPAAASDELSANAAANNGSNGALAATANNGNAAGNAQSYPAPHAPHVQPALAPTMGGADQPHMDNHPIERQARAVFEASKTHPDLHGCYAPVDQHYDPSQQLMQENPAMVPPYQQVLKDLPATQRMNFQQEFAGTNIGPNAREGIDLLAPTTLDTATTSPEQDFDFRVKQTEGAGVSNIYRRGDGKGIALINQKSRMTDPTKLLPQVDPERQNERMVQAGPSIADIGCRVPKAADIMKMLRASRGSVLSHTIPRDKPPLYTEGLNAVRATTLPSASGGAGSCAIGINPYEVSDLVDYYPNPFLKGSRAAGTPYNYVV